MSKKLSQTKMKSAYKYVIGAPYCALQSLLRYKTPVAYATRVEGWACDLFELSYDVAVATGYSYSRAVDTKIEYQIIADFEKRAQACTTRQEIDDLIAELVSYIKKNA